MHVGEVSAEIRTEIFDVLSGAEEATCIATPEMEVLWINPAMERLAGIPAADAAGSDVLWFFAERVLQQADEPSAAAILSSIQSRTEEKERECRIGGPEREAWYAYTSRRLERGTLAGAWILTFRGITAQKRAAREHERCFGDLAYLSRAATGLAALPPDADLFAVIGSYIHEIAPDSIVIVSTADIRAGTLTPRALFGMEYCLPRVIAILGREITGITLNLPRNIREIMARGEIAEIKGGLEAVALWQIPLDICQKIEEVGGFGAMYCIPFTWKGEVFGTAVVLTRREGAPVRFEAIDTFKNLAAIALQRHQAEERLRKREETFRALIEKSSDFILVLDDLMKIRFASPPIERIDGISPQMLVGKSAFDMMLPEEVPRAQKLMSDLLKKPGSSVPFEVRFRGPRGMHVIEAMVTNLLDDPQVQGVVVNARDITDRKQAEEALRQAERNKALILDSTAEMFTYYDTDLRILWANRAAAALLDRKPEDLVGHFCYEAWHNRTGICEGCPVVLARETKTPHEAEITTPDGRVFFLRGYPVTDEKGEVVGLIEFGQEITERKQTEQELRFKDMAMAASLNAIALTDPAQKVFYVNQAVLDLWGYDAPEEVLGRSISLFWANPRHLETVMDAVRREGHWSGEELARRRDGTAFPAQISVVRVTAEDGTLLGHMGSVLDISEQKQAQEALRAANAYNRSLIEANLDPLVTIGSNGRITDVNAATEAATGYARDELIGTDFSDYFTDPAEARAGYRRVFAEGQVRDYPLEIRHRDGHTIPVLYNATVYRDEEGAVAGVFAAARDITERKRADEALAQSEQRLTDIINFLPDATFAVDSDGKVIAWNRAIEEMTGVAAGEVLGKSDHVYGIPLYGEKRPLLIDMVFRDDEEIRKRYPYVQKKGDKFISEAYIQHLYGGKGAYLWFTASPLYDTRGNVIGAIESIRDITERKEAEEAIQRRNTELSLLNRLISVSASALSLDELLESTLATSIALLNFDCGAVYLLDRELSLATLMSRQGMERPPTGFETIDVSRHPFEEIFATGRQLSISAGETTDDAEKRILDAFGVASLVLIPLTAESRIMGALALGSLAGRQVPQEDRWLREAISREIGAGILRGMLYKQLETANREANLYLDILTHDIRNVNSVATMYTDLLVEILEGEPKIYVQKMKSSIDKSTEILANVAMIRKIHEEHAPLKPIDLQSVILGEQKNFPDTTIRYAGQPRMVWADDLLPEVFSNLIGNAVKFGGPDVTVMISVETVDDSVVVTVADTGPGIPDDLKKAIFHRFERGQTRARGEGLGLYICHKLLERYGGRIWVEDRVPGRPEMGAALRFTLKEVAQR